MCEGLNAAYQRHNAEGITCCSNDGEPCGLTTEVELARESCAAVSAAADFLRAAFADYETDTTAEKSLLWGNYIELQSAVGDLTKHLLVYLEGD